MRAAHLIRGVAADCEGEAGEVGARSAAAAELAAGVCVRPPQANGACAAEVPVLSKAVSASSESWEHLHPMTSHGTGDLS